MHLVPQTLRYKIWLCSSLTKLKTSSIEYVLMILVGSYTQCVTGVLSPQKQLQSESLAKQFNTLSIYPIISKCKNIGNDSSRITKDSNGITKQGKRILETKSSFVFKNTHLYLISTFCGVYG